MGGFQKERIACAYFFAAVGLGYGVFTARLPAFKEMIGADDGQIGCLLLAFGLASLCGLLGSRRVIGVLGVKLAMGAGAAVFMLALSLGALAFGYAYLVGCCMLAGFAGGIGEVAMNAQGIDIEKRHNALCMASLHACFSLGGLAGSGAGALFAAFMPVPVYNFIVVCGLYLLLWPFAYQWVAESGQPGNMEKKRNGKSRMPAFIGICGVMSMMCYISEGSVGDWGSILLHSVKGAPQPQAALVFGCFCSTMVIFRFFGDRLRRMLGDFPVVIGGALLGCVCMSTVLLSSSSLVGLAAYMVMGMGFAPIVPILFSRAGQYPGMDASEASSIISIMSYSGLLVFSPLVGMLGDVIGLGNAFWLVPVACLIVACGSPILLKKQKNV